MPLCPHASYWTRDIGWANVKHSWCLGIPKAAETRGYARENEGTEELAAALDSVAQETIVQVIEPRKGREINAALWCEFAALILFIGLLCMLSNAISGPELPLSASSAPSSSRTNAVKVAYAVSY